MKSFRLLTQQISQWKQTNLLSVSQKRLHHLFQSAITYAKRHSSPHEPMPSLLGVKPNHFARAVLAKNVSRRKQSAPPPPPRPLILGLAIVSLTSAIGYRFYNEPQLAVDTIAPQTLRAPDSARVEDTETTKANQQEARLGSAPVLMIDQAINQEIYDDLQRLVEEAKTLRSQVGQFPFVETSILSTSTQIYLRQAPDQEWQSAIAAAQSNAPVGLPPTNDTDGIVNSSRQVAIVELQNYRRTNPPEDFVALRQVVSRARQRYATAVAKFSAPEASNHFYDASLLNLTDAEWNETVAAVRRGLERMLWQGIAPGASDELLQNAIRVQLADSTPAVGSALANRMLRAVVQANLVPDVEKTRLRAEQAARDVEPVIVEIRRGEVIVEQGEMITQSNFVLLDYFNMSQRGINWLGLVGFGALVAGGVLVFVAIERRFHPGLRRRDHGLIWLLVLTAPMIVALEIPTTSLPLVGLLVGSFYGSVLGVAVVGLLGIALPIGMDIGARQLIASAIAGLLGAAMAGRLRSREELAMLGGAVGLTQGVVYLILSLIFSVAPSPVWYAVLTAAALQGLLGVACSIVALGLSPYLENLFDLITPIRLAELSNPNRPLLKRLASEAPGTFQHTLFVASLAEAAARALGCNVELVRAGTLYHDIGKMHDAMGFIENQMGKPNKHDAINNPWKSCNIIKKHVSEGLVMAKKYRLPGAIQAFIPEHQGTMLIAYFYHEAQQRAKENPKVTVQESEFRYDGPIPQSRETGIVMLADSCEAALRSLKDATPEEALAMVNRIMRARWQDNQLVDSGLTRAELSRIAQIFVRVWQQFNHQRIAYPKLTPSPASQPSTSPK
ncbi:HDIG domain-containing protein [Oscillatoria sp. FACHB-1407]|uniref:HD family phosphohydrolase n=1 Tax=Oscillatoria sp. FACHB-1407 TaxID=2692847 RepID=UPI001687793F|nr:HDIG domain-containing metalloprotein [Oscillatoria sp. FACHB-1407]MBD2462724.1 HDIG domain-containing protein [Oscillatoria sp. FACHB-1407]